MYAKLLSAGLAAGIFSGTCDMPLDLYGPGAQVPTIVVATDYDYDFGYGGKPALYRSEPEEDDDPDETPDGAHDPEKH